MNAADGNLIAMAGVTLRFSEKVVLDGVNLSLKAHEVLVIMGMSGSGKSTLLSILLGLVKPDDGDVRYKDLNLTTLSRRKWNEVRMHIGMVYQNAALISSLSVRENVSLPLHELTTKTEDEIASIVSQKLEIVGLKDIEDKLPSELSGGMEKRVGLARALALDPELVLFDEPSAGLDPINSKLINDLIIRLQSEHQVTSIVVTHEMPSAFQVASKMAFLHEGKIILEGTPDEFRRSENPTISAFLSSFSNQEQNKR